MKKVSLCHFEGNGYYANRSAVNQTIQMQKGGIWWEPVKSGQNVCIWLLLKYCTSCISKSMDSWMGWTSPEMFQEIWGMDFNGEDFEQDLTVMYIEICQCLVVDFCDEFGPEAPLSLKANERKTHLPPQSVFHPPFFLIYILSDYMIAF